jgi:hypothetical protein
MLTRILLLAGLLLVIAGCDSTGSQATPTAITGGAGTGGTGGTGTGSAPAGLGASLQGMIDGPLAAIDSAMLTQDVEKARAAFKELDTAWTQIEDGVKAVSPDAYTQIEDAKDKLEDALIRTEDPKGVAVGGAVGSLRSALRALIDTLP